MWVCAEQEAGSCGMRSPVCSAPARFSRRTRWQPRGSWKHQRCCTGSARGVYHPSSGSCGQRTVSVLNSPSASATASTRHPCSGADGSATAPAVGDCGLTGKAYSRAASRVEHTCRWRRDLGSCRGSCYGSRAGGRACLAATTSAICGTTR